MSTYAAPLRDMKFVINELADLASITALPGCEEVTPDLVDSVLEEAAKFATGVLDPLNRTGDRQGCRLDNNKVYSAEGFKEAYRQFVEGGWNGLSGDAEFGGQGLPYLVATPVQEMWNSSNMAFCLCPMLTSGTAEALLSHGSPEQQERYLAKLVSGEWSGTMNLTEPQAGSDLSAVRMRAVPEGDRYRLYGVKIFITWGEHDMAQNIIHLALARTPNAPEGVKGISLFVVPKYLVNSDGSLGERNDVKCVSLEHKLGIHASPTAVMAYGDEKGAVGYLVGEENRGLEYMFTMMNHARLGVGVEGVAIAERAYQHALTYAKDRVQGRPVGAKSAERVAIIHHPDVRRMLMLMKSQNEAMRAVAYIAAAALDRANRHPDEVERARNQAVVDLLIPIVKGWCTELAVEIASTGVQVHGGMGFVEETGAAQYLRDARITTIYEGTTGIQANDLVGRKIAREKGATALAVMAEMRRFCEKLSGSQDVDSQAIRASLTRGVDALGEATEWLVANHDSNPKAVYAGAVPYLKLFGTVAGGWQMARAAAIARKKLDSGDADRAFYQAKIATARFYADCVLPQALGLGHAVTHGGPAVLALEEAQF
jgi:alkylation response protein AidB-like acyl-CoA dehydrogenase